MSNKLSAQIIFICIALSLTGCSSEKTMEDSLEDFKNNILKEKTVSKNFLLSFGVETLEEFRNLKTEKPIPLVILNGESIPNGDALNKILQDSTNLTYMVAYTKDSVVKCKTIVRNINGKISVVLIERSCGEAIKPFSGITEYRTIYLGKCISESRPNGVEASLIIRDFNRTEIAMFRDEGKFLCVPLKSSANLVVGQPYELSKIQKIFKANYRNDISVNGLIHSRERTPLNRDRQIRHR